MGLFFFLYSNAQIPPWEKQHFLFNNSNNLTINGIVKDTSGHVIQNANVKIWKAENPSILDLTETDFNGEYTTDIATPVEETNYNKMPLTVLNNGNSSHIGFTGTVPEEPQQIQIINSIGQLIANIPFEYDINSHLLQANWQAEKPGIYFANIITNTNKEVLKFLATNNNIPPTTGIANQSTLKSTQLDELIKYYIYNELRHITEIYRHNISNRIL